MTTTEVPYPRALARFPSLRQSTLSSFDNCSLLSFFEREMTTGWSYPWQSRGSLFHRFAARALAEMYRQQEEQIEVDVALAILQEVLAQRDVDRQCPHCGSQRIRRGVTRRGNRYCLACKRTFESRFVNIDSKGVNDLRWIVKKWAYDNTFSIRYLVDIEQRLSATVSYSNPHGGQVDREINGQLDVLFLDEQDETSAIVVDWKDTWGMPGPSEVSEDGYFQQKVYALLVMQNYRRIERVTMREFYVRYSEPREATIRRDQLEAIEDELSALVERFDRSVEEKLYRPTPGHHCARASTRFITDTGIRTLGEACGERVRVLNRHGEWEDAEVRSFGVQPLLRVTFNGGEVVEATPDHRWWTTALDRHTGTWQQTGERVTTVELEHAPLGFHAEAPLLDEDGIRHGIVYGDGWVRADRGHSVVKFEGVKRELARYFDGPPLVVEHLPGQFVEHARVTERKDGRLYCANLPASYKALPDRCSPAYARGFIAGLIATDGSVARQTGQVRIHCEGCERAEGIAELARLGGCAVTSVSVLSVRVPAAIGGVPLRRAGELRELCAITIKPATAPVIRSGHLANLKSRHQMRGMYRTVVSVEPMEPEEVFCVVAPGSESFTLANGIVTSNCSYCPAPVRCPIKSLARGSGRITDPEEAKQVAAELIVGRQIVKQNRTALEAWCEKHGEVPVRYAKGRRVFGFRPQTRTYRPDAAAIEAEELAQGRSLSAAEIKALYRVVEGTSFGDYSPRPAEAELTEEALLDALRASVG